MGLLGSLGATGLVSKIGLAVVLVLSAFVVFSFLQVLNVFFWLIKIIRYIVDCSTIVCRKCNDNIEIVDV